MSTKEVDLCMRSWGPSIRRERTFQANPRYEKCRVEHSILEKISRIKNDEKILFRYKQSVEEMRNTGLLVHICATRNGSLAMNAPETQKFLHYGALTLAFGQAVCLAKKVSSTNSKDGPPQISFHQIQWFITYSMRAWRINQTPQLSCSRMDFDLDSAFTI